MPADLSSCAMSTTISRQSQVLRLLYKMPLRTEGSFPSLSKNDELESDVMIAFAFPVFNARLDGTPSPPRCRQRGIGDMSGGFEVGL